MTSQYRCDLELAYRSTLEKFTSVDGARVVTFERNGNMFDVASRQGLRNHYIRVSGAAYSFDNYRFGDAPVDIATETVRYILLAEYTTEINALLRDLRSKLRMIGLGRLWRLEGADTRYWAYARARDALDFDMTDENRLHVPVVLSFDRLSDWQVENAVTVTETINSDGEQWTVNNPGDIRARLMTIRLRANASGGFTNPQIENLTNLSILKSNRDSISSNSEIRYDTDRRAVDWSNDNGVTYTDDFANYVVPTIQPPLSFVLEPGANTLRYTGVTPNLDVEITYRPTYG